MRKLTIALLALPLLLYSQNSSSDTSTIVRHYYKDKVLLSALYKGADKRPDSLKTYHSNGQLKELFYFDEKGLKDSNAYQYDQQGDKQVSLKFSHGKLLSRFDHKLPFNNVNKEILQSSLKQLQEINTRTFYNPSKPADIYKRGNLHYRLGNTILALDDLKRSEKILQAVSKKAASDLTAIKKLQAHLYDLLANIYLGAEQKNLAGLYYYKAIMAAPKDSRILYNFANYLHRNQSEDLALFFLNKLNSQNPNFGFVQLSLAQIYSDKGQYQKALEHINTAFQLEDAIKKGSTGWQGRDLRTTRGLIYHKLGLSEKGIADLNEALLLNDKNSYAMKNLAIIYLDQKKYSEACSLLEKADKLHYTLVFDEKDLHPLLQSACNHKTTVNPIAAPKAVAYPNPVTTKVLIRNYPHQHFDYIVYDMETRPLLRGRSEDSSVDISSLKQGLYLLQVSNQDDPQTFKVIKD